MYSNNNLPRKPRWSAKSNLSSCLFCQCEQHHWFSESWKVSESISNKSHDYLIIAITISQCFCSLCWLQMNVFWCGLGSVCLIFWKVVRSFLNGDRRVLGSIGFVPFIMKQFLETSPIWYPAIYLIYKQFILIRFLCSLPVLIYFWTNARKKFLFWNILYNCFLVIKSEKKVLHSSKREV